MLDQAVLKRLKHAYKCIGTHPALNIFPFTKYDTRGGYDAIGKKRLAQGKVGCILVAGGQGTRLGWNGPKGTFPLSTVNNKSLFQLFAERVAAASRRYGHALPVAIMTSSLNHDETVMFFEEHRYFGLKPGQISFFQQGVLPLLDEEGEPFMDAPGQVAMGPDGNGVALHHFYSSGIFSEWQSRGIENVNFVQVDNALNDPFDAQLVGYHECDVTVKCVTRKAPSEKVGVLVDTADGVRVVEYSELSDDERLAKNADGSLKHSCANISQFCFCMSFIERVAQMEFPLHAAHKAAARLGEPIPDAPNAWKFEAFIFDVLSEAQEVRALLYPRGECFAPVKNRAGADSPDSARALIQQYDRQVMELLTGRSCPEGEFELDPDLYYP
jgi:UDP-N-acetylglucosamine/UDP-N-acetylgalactosamine diphosphorylase